MARCTSRMTGGWNFYRISYFDWLNDESSEKKALADYIQQYFDDSSRGTKSEVLKELEGEMIAPEEASKEMYVTDFSDEDVDHVSSVGIAQPVPSVKSAASAKKEFSVGVREVNQDDFGNYLASHVGNVINVRYQTPRANSANRWRPISLVKYDETYFYADAANDRDYLIKYRRDRVVEFR